MKTIIIIYMLKRRCCFPFVKKFEFDLAFRYPVVQKISIYWRHITYKNI